MFLWLPFLILPSARARHMPSVSPLSLIVCSVFCMVPSSTEDNLFCLTVCGLLLRSSPGCTRHPDKGNPGGARILPGFTQELLPWFSQHSHSKKSASRVMLPSEVTGGFFPVCPGSVFLPSLTSILCCSHTESPGGHMCASPFLSPCHLEALSAMNHSQPTLQDWPRNLFIASVSNVTISSMCLRGCFSQAVTKLDTHNHASQLESLEIQSFLFIF